MKKSDVVIIGGGPAGRIIVHMLHAAEQNLSVTLIKDEEINVNRCAVPYGVSNKKPIEKFQISNKLVTDFGGELVIDRVERVDFTKKEVYTKQGETYIYEHLVFATGSRPFLPPIPGIESDKITPVRSLQDLSMLRQLAANHRRAVIIGGGYIGVEVAVEFQKMGLQVTLVEMLPQILKITTEPEFISEIEKALVEKGIRLLTSHKVVEFEDRGDQGVGVIFEGGQTIDTDFVVMSVGVIPNTEVAAQSGLETSPLGIVTNDYLRPNAENVYASGDCAEMRSFITHKPIRGEFGTNAVFMSKVVAKNILGENRVFPGVINANVSTAFEWSFGSAGLTEKAAIDAGFSITTGYSEVLDGYPMIDGTSYIHTKLIFNRNDRKLIGGSVLRKGHCVAANVDFISFAIQMGTTIDDLLVYQYCTHPELAAKPSDNIFVFAAKDAMSKL